jgi:putative endonuclease
MYHVYLLLCEDNSIYTGVTTDIERRFSEHKNKHGSAYTNAKGAEKIIYQEQFLTRSEAMKREAEIKKWRREKKLELIRKGG